jgi:small-conductance mechanosensitive channel
MLCWVQLNPLKFSGHLHHSCNIVGLQQAQVSACLLSEMKICVGLCVFLHKFQLCRGEVFWHVHEQKKYGYVHKEIIKTRNWYGFSMAVYWVLFVILRLFCFIWGKSLTVVSFSNNSLSFLDPEASFNIYKNRPLSLSWATLIHPAHSHLISLRYVNNVSSTPSSLSLSLSFMFSR